MVALRKEQAIGFELSPTLEANEEAVRRRAAGEEVLHMGFGQSPFPVPERLLKALQDNAGKQAYLQTSGLPELRSVIADYYEKNAGLDRSLYDVVIAPGSKLSLYSLQIAVDGDLLMPVPSWVSYEPQAELANCKVIKVPTKLDEEGYHIDPETLKDIISLARAEGLNPTKIILNNPSNPTGLKMPEDEMEAIAAICVAEDLMIISDEIYGFLSFDGKYTSISKYAPDHTVITSGLSKHLSLGGWRVGISLVPKKINGLHPLLCTIASEIWSCVAGPIQYAGIEAYKNHPDLEKHIHDCRHIHAFMSKHVAKGLQDMGVDCPAPQGAFYCYPNFRSFKDGMSRNDINTSKDLSRHLVNEYGLVTLPGIAFGEEDDVLTLRLSPCDYNGSEVLQAYQNGEELNDSFISKHAPSLEKSMEAFTAFTKAMG